MNDEVAIFNEAIAISDAAERARYLDGACRGDANLRSRLEVLLKAQFEPVQFLASPENEPSARETEGSVIGPYKLLQQIVEGGFGVVYMAEQKEPMRRRIREEEAVRSSARVSTMDAITRSTTAERRKVAPQKLSRQMEGDLDWIVLKALENDRARRYETAKRLGSRCAAVHAQ